MMPDAPEPRPPADRRRRLVVLAAALVVIGYVVVAYRGAVQLFYFLDDWWMLRDAARACGADGVMIGQIFRPGPAGFLLYRPLTAVGYGCVLRLLFGYDATPYHGVQILVFAANAVVVLLIVRRLTGSTLAGLAAALLFAAAPGQAVGVYWLSAFSITGTALAVLLLCWCWLILRGWRRVVACTALQAVALLCGEHAVLGPALLLVVSAADPRRVSWRQTIAALLGPGSVAAAYAAAKVAYLIVWHPPSTYAMVLDPWIWLRHLGAYFAACFNVLFELRLSDDAATTLGAELLVIAVFAAWRAARGGGREWRLIAAGIAFFTLALIPVLPLADHFYEFYVGLAATGAALTVVGACLGAPRVGSCVALAIALATVITGLRNDHRAWRESELFQFVERSTEIGARWMVAAQTAGSGGVAEVLIPYDRVTERIFIVGQVETFFPGAPRHVLLYDAITPPTPGPTQAVLIEPPPELTPGQALPGSSPSWNWLRALAGDHHHAGHEEHEEHEQTRAPGDAEP